MSSERQRFLARVREALGRGTGGPAEGWARSGPSAGIDPSLRRSQDPALVNRGDPPPQRADDPGSDPAAWPARFAAELEAVGGTADFSAPEEVGRRVAAYGTRLGVRRVLAWDPEALAGQEAGLLASALQALSEAGFEVRTWPAEAADVELGVVVAEAAIAASGTVMISSGRGKGRSVSLLPEHLLVLVPAKALRPTLAAALADVARRTRGGDVPHNVTLITGPSKSADIEQKLIQGVHGPRTVHALLVAAPS